VKGTKLVALVADRPAERALAAGDSLGLAHVAFQQRSSGSSAPLVVRADLGAGGMPFSTFSAIAGQLQAQPWMRSSLASEVAVRPPRKTVRLLAGKPTRKTPAGYWEEVREGRSWAGALAAGLGPDTPEAATAQHDSLVAECSAWAGPASDWALADRGRAFANSSTRMGKSVFDPVSLKVESITLAGSRGEVPVIVSNGNERALTVRVSAVPSRGVRISGDHSSLMRALPKDNFIELPVDLRESLAGRIRVTVSAGGVVLEQESVAVRASYLDRLVTIVGVVLVLGALLTFIIRRVRAAEGSGTISRNGEAETTQRRSKDRQ
jgi:hypothetical protein